MAAEGPTGAAVARALAASASRSAGTGVSPLGAGSRSRRVQFFALIGAIGCAFAAHVATMAITAERKVALQRDGVILLDLMNSWHRLLQVTNQLPYREDRPESAWREGVQLFSEFELKLGAFAAGIDRERLLDRGRRHDMASLAQGLRFGNQFVREAYDDLGRFIEHNRSAGHDSILASTMYDILRNVGGYSYEENDLLHFSRMYQDVRTLGFSFSNQLDAKQERIQAAIEQEILRLTRLYSGIEVALLVFVGVAVALLLWRLLALFRSLQESEELHRTLFLAMAEGVCLVDREDRIAALNPAAERLAGHPSAALLGKRLGEGVLQAIREDGTPVAPGTGPAARALRTGDAQTDLVMGLRPADGAVVWTSVNAQPLVAGDGRPSAVVITLRDITERKRAEDALRRTEERLRQAQKMEAIGNLAGGVAHDFNNLLSVILGGCGMLAEELPDGHAGRATLDEIRVAGERAADLTRRLLAFSRKQILLPQVVNLNGVVHRTERMLERLIGEDVELVVAVAPDLDAVKVDPGQLEQVIMNLAVNARDAMPRGGRLTIETANVVLDGQYAAEHVGSAPGPHVMLAMTDTGVGMDQETQQRMFEPFFTTKERGKGTGLGLATVLGIVQQSGGHLQVQSAPGKGTTFRIFLPSTTELPADERAPAAGRDPSRGTETILVVEDEEQVRTLLEVVLRRAGYRVIAAPGGSEALRAWQASPGSIQLVLTDVVMPDMSGLVLAERLRALCPEVKVLYTSGYTDEAILRHGVLEPGTHFMPKPFTPEAVTRKVREVLDGR